MRIGIAKEAVAFRGGFELLITKIAASLSERGHEVGHIEPVATDVRLQNIPDNVRSRAPEYFHYVEQIERFRQAPANVDVVLSTQPPSQAVAHEHQVALFYHHLRLYYDLSDVWVAAGFADVAEHGVCEQSVRRLDEHTFANTSHFLAGSETIKRRLEIFNDASEITDVLRAPSLRPIPGSVDGSKTQHVLCVGRHEFPKRTELGAAAMKLLRHLEAVFVGTGGRLGWLMAEDRRWTRMSPGEMADLPSQEIWLRRHDWIAEVETDPNSNIRFVGWVPDGELESLYRDALCVIAPAYDEDYGLTALEAMAHSKPVIVCSDGGGLAEMVVDGETGLIVAPDHNAIATAIARLDEDHRLAAELGRNGRDFVQELDWTVYMDHIEDALEAQT